MKYLVFIFLLGCSVTAQEPSKDLKDDAEFEQLLKQVEASAKESVLAQTKADEQQKQIVKQVVKQIVELKTELNEAKARIDSIDSDTGVAFKLLPISNH
jgi:hypothetical protein